MDRISASLALSGIFFKNSVASGVRCGAEEVGGALELEFDLEDDDLDSLVLEFDSLSLDVELDFGLSDVSFELAFALPLPLSLPLVFPSTFADASVICDAAEAAAAAAGEGLDDPLVPATRLAHEPGVFGFEDETSSFFPDLPLLFPPASSVGEADRDPLLPFLRERLLALFFFDFFSSFVFVGSDVVLLLLLLLLLLVSFFFLSVLFDLASEEDDSFAFFLFPLLLLLLLLDDEESFFSEVGSCLFFFCFDFSDLFSSFLEDGADGAATSDATSLPSFSVAFTLSFPFSTLLGTA